MKDEIDVEINKMTEGEDSFGVRADLSGPLGELSVRHAFPKKDRFLDEDEDGVPKFVKKLKSIYLDRAESDISNLGNKDKSLEDYERKY